MGKIKEHYYKMSMKKSLISLFSMAVCCICILSGITIYASNMAQQKIVQNRGIIINASDTNIENKNGSLYVTYDKNKIHWEPLSIQRKIGYYGCYIAMIGLPIAYIFIGISIASTIYYRFKLRKPISELMKGISSIQNNDLDFIITYDNQDELGELCASMEKMRFELRQSNKRLWEMIEQRKLLNASVAHDIRTPITVLKGYLDYLNKNIPQDKLTEEMVMETVQYMREATERLEHYADCIRDFEKAESIEVHTQEEQTADVIQETKRNVEQLASVSEKEIILQSSISLSTINVDKQLLFRIVENLVQNAIRYARHNVMIGLSSDKGFIEIAVEDDGKGFSAVDLEQATTLFYSNEKEDSHFGLGLSISKLLCEKQGGTLSIGNSLNGGAVVIARIKNI